MTGKALAWAKNHVNLFPWRDRVTPSNVRDDFFAGITNAAVVLPQGVAFAAIAGLPPEYGLYTAMITPVVAALFGSSYVMISGPTTAISAVVFAALSPLYAPESGAFIMAALVLTLMAGVIQLCIGLAKLGRLAAFVSNSVMIGFTAAAAILIGVSQLAGALGVVTERGGSVLERLHSVALAAADGVDWRAIVIAAVTIAATLLVPRLHKKLPAFLIALVLGTLTSFVVGTEGLRTVGVLPSVLPSFSPVLPTVEQAGILAESAIAIALIGLLEAVAIGRAFASRTDAPFSANQEIIGQGLSNIAGSMFQAYPGSGSFTRSGLNYESGAKTPLSAVFASLGLVAILFAIAPLVQYIPIAAMSGLIIMVAVRLVNIANISHIVKSGKSEATILIVTFLIGVMIELELSIFIGVMLALGNFVKRTMNPKFAVAAPDPNTDRRTFRNAEVHHLPECPQMMMGRFDGPLYFGSSEMLEIDFRRVASSRSQQKVMLVDLKGVGEIDIHGVDCLIREARRRQSIGGDLYVIVRAAHSVKRLRRLGLNAELGDDHVLPDKQVAVRTVVPKLDQSICATCDKRIFSECPAAPTPDPDDHEDDV